jgi:hypothetical protein
MGLGRPVSRILLYPAIHLRGLVEPRAPSRSRAYQPGEFAGAIWLARTGSLPGRSLAGYRRWALTPPFHPSPVPKILLRPSAGLLSVALDVAVGLRRATPRVLSPSGLSGPGYPDPRESGLCSASRETLGCSGGSDGPDPPLIIPYLRQVLGSRRRARAPPRLRRTILVGVRRSSTLSVPLQRFCQRGSSPTAGSNQTPGDSEASITPS